MDEGRTIQYRLNSQHNQSQRSSEHTARVAPDTPETVREALMKKHSSSKPSTQSAIVAMDGPASKPHSVMFDRIDGDLYNTKHSSQNRGSCWTIWS